MEKIPMTRAGFDQLDLELRDLKAVERPAVIRAIAEAREHGDLSENAEYHAAREKQSFIEGRIKELEMIISRAEVIDVLQRATLPGGTHFVRAPRNAAGTDGHAAWVRELEPQYADWTTTIEDSGGERPTFVAPKRTG